MRQIKDAAMEVTHALPAAAANVDTATLDMGVGASKAAPNDDAARDGFLVEVEVDATPSLVDAKTITVIVKDSADDSTYATVAAVPAQVITGAGGAGGGRLRAEFRLPPTTRRYLRANAAVLTAGGDNTAKNFYLRLLF